MAARSMQSKSSLSILFSSPMTTRRNGKANKRGALTPFRVTASSSVSNTMTRDAMRRNPRSVQVRVNDALQDVTTEEGYPDSRGSSQVYFYKYQGLGNDFIMVDNRHCPDPIFSSEEAVALCDRR
mmetsp:Transcript_12688/g.35441  ORF Transcript_12688/g.35441 Transcript_12688/m.35441 type:complete len:125 (-) Transcript_12688:1143-1517(-)